MRSIRDPLICGAIAIAAVLACASLGPSPAAAASANATPVAAQSDQATAADTEFSSRWRGRRYRVVRPYPPISRFGYYRPRPYFYRPYYYAAPYPYVYGPVVTRPYFGPPPFYGVGFGFGPRYYW